MEAADLRIGNLIIEKGAIESVEPSHFYEDDYVKNLLGCEPIPLTEEWLLKFGFRDISKLDNTTFKEYRQYNKPSLAIQFPCGSETHCYAGNYPVAIRHVHQLQNLYFALTGEELVYEI